MRKSIRLVSQLWRLMIGLWVLLALITVIVVGWRIHTTARETICLQFASVSDNYQLAYPTVIDTRRGIIASLPDRTVPDVVTIISENGSYRVRQSYHLDRIFSVPYQTVVETIATGATIKLPTAVSNNSVVWSPDGSQFAYYNLDTSTINKIFSLVIANADGSNSINLPLTQFNLIHFLNWSPDSQYLLVADYFHLWLIRADNRQVQVIEPQKQDERVDTIQWSPQGHLLAYLWAETRIIPNHIVIFDPDTGSRQIYVRTDEKYWWDGRLLWSDDLRYVAAVGWMDGQIDILGRDGTGVSLNNVGWDGKSTATLWIPASDRFVFMTDDDELIIYDVPTASYQPLVSHLLDTHLEMMDDQHSLVFTQRLSDGAAALVKLDMRDKRITSLITPQANGWISRFYRLADRNKIVVVMWENDGLNVDLLDVKTGERQRLASDLGNFDMQRIWSDPATFMFYWSTRDKTTHIPINEGWEMYDLTGKQQYQFQVDLAVIRSTYAYDGQRFVPFWSPDHRWAVFTGNDPDLFKGLVVVSSDGQKAWQSEEEIWGIDFNHIVWSPDSSKVVLIVNIHGESIGLVYTSDGKLLAKAKMPLSADYLQWTNCDF